MWYLDIKSSVLNMDSHFKIYYFVGALSGDCEF